MAVLPLVALIGLLCWQAVVAGQAIWLSGSAARAAARASALGRDPATAARRALPGSLARGVRVRSDAPGSVDLHLTIPAVVGGLDLAAVRARARFVPQT